MRSNTLLNRGSCDFSNKGELELSFLFFGGSAEESGEAIKLYKGNEKFNFEIPHKRR